MEEAHFLSILYAARSYANQTANSFIKRMWTGFRVNNVTQADFGLAIWHLPAEKSMGFARLFRKICRTQDEMWKRQSNEEHERNLARVFGIPHRGLKKFVFDISIKLREKGRRFLRRMLASILLFLPKLSDREMPRL